jgi:hypothetical protein
MNKGNLIRAGILFSLFVIILGAAWGCSYVKDKNVTPEITNKDGIYLSVEDIDVTNQELWEQMKLSDGLAYLEKYIEENFLFTTEISEVTQIEIDEKIEYYKFGTNDVDDLATIMEDQELVDSLIKQFEENLIALGYDPQSADDLQDFVELDIAKENAVRAYISNAVGEDALAIEDRDIGIYYYATVLGDVSAINIIFSSEAEANAVFEEFNLVPNYNLGWGRYTGSDYSSGDFEGNTDQLTDAEVLSKFILMYNYMNPIDTLIAVDSNLTDFVSLNGDEFVYNYKDMIEDRADTDVYIELADYMFNTLNLEDDHARYSFMLQEFGDFQVLTYKVSQDEVAEYEELDTAFVAELREELLDSKVNASNYEIVVSSIWDAAEYEIFDPYFKLQNVNNEKEEFSNHGDIAIVATINGTDITSDMLYAYMKERVGVYYSIEIVKTELLLSSSAYTDIYGDDHDYMNSKLEAMVKHQDELRVMKTNFSGDKFASYGFSSTVYSWDEFLSLAFNAKSEADLIRDVYVIPAVSPYFTIDSIDYANAADIVQKIADEFFSLNINHLLIYVDVDKDLSLDKFEDFYDGLEGADLVEYTALADSLKTLILAKIEDDYTFEEIVTEFNDSLLEDPLNDWAEYKEYGFLILTQDLSTNSSLDPSTTTNYDPSFTDGLKDLYDRYVILDAVNSNGVAELYDETLIKTDFGLHFLYATKGTNFDVPTAEYSEIDDVDDLYLDKVNNANIIPSLGQVEEFIKIEFATDVTKATDATLPASVYAAVGFYFGGVYESYFTPTAYSIEAINYMLDNSVTFEENATTSLTYLEDILGILYGSNFTEDFIVPE